MKHLIIKIKDNDIYTDEFNYYVKHINRNPEDVFKTYQNDMYEIPGMTDENEKSLVFLGNDYFAVMNVLEKEDSEDEDGDEDDSEHSEKEEAKGEDVSKTKESEGDKGYSIHRLSDGTQMCFLPDNKDFKFLKNSNKGVDEGAAISGILD
jgi:hypothetical protein